MTADRYVFLDPDGSHEDWIYVLVAAPTGVVYGQQYGGTSCRQGEVEGYLVPVHAPAALSDLRWLFESTFHGAGTYGHRWLEPELSRLRQAVSDVEFWKVTRDGDADEPQALQLDMSALNTVDEAWVPVLTPDGPGILVWQNSD